MHTFKSYDKIFLVSSFALMLGSYGFYFFQENPIAKPNLSNNKPTGGRIAMIALKPYSPASLTWEEPPAQDEEGLWHYDIFTPPKIWWDTAAQALVAQPPDTEAPRRLSQFGIYLAAIEPMLYRIQFDAYFDGIGDPNNALIQFYDRETDTTCRGKIGEHFANSDFTILTCSNRVEALQDGTRSTVTRAIIEDMRTNQKIELNSEEKHYVEGAYRLVFATTPEPYGPGYTFVLNKPGDGFQIEEDTFTLLEFDSGGQTATVRKNNLSQSPQQNIEHRTLNIEH